jgi:hypothetical protein
MTKDEILKTFLEDPLFQEKGYVTKDKINKLQFGESSGVKLIEVIKLAISGNVEKEGDQITSRKITAFLNK